MKPHFGTGLVIGIALGIGLSILTAHIVGKQIEAQQLRFLSEVAKGPPIPTP